MSQAFRDLVLGEGRIGKDLALGAEAAATEDDSAAAAWLFRR
jgi:hypothetical protein